jgi:hypothetical protein
MTEALAAAVASASRLPAEEQDVLAALLMAEMDSEERWNTLFSQSQGVLEDLAKRALGEHEVDQGAEV